MLETIVVLVKIPEQDNRVLVAVYPEEQTDGSLLYVPYPASSSRRLAQRSYIYQQDVLATFIDKQSSRLVYARSYEHLAKLNANKDRYQYTGLGKYALANAL